MDTERWLKIKAILDQLSEISKDRRAQMLLELVGDDTALRLEVEEFFAVEDEADDFLEQPLWRVSEELSQLFDTSLADTRDANSTPRAAALGSAGEDSFSDVFGDDEDVTRIGPYRLQGLLGQGGMAQVHLAVREDDYQQEVALKRVLGPVDRPQLRERFVNERQILANLQHPGIARLLDGGTDAKGFPFLVMEYVEGEPIDAYCQDHGLSIDERLRLFGQVCSAVHHAHQNLVVHRDLKPSNILVTSTGQVRLLDFGIAKLLAHDDDHQLTAEGQAPMTPAYASPEQMMGEPVTTGSDVYALGVLLYVLLTDQKPYDLEGRNFAALAHKICFDDPLPPSQRVLAETPSQPYDERAVRRASRLLKGDLDAIVMKAMRKEPGQRYQSAAELEADITHYLEGSPVRAHDGNWLYHTGKYLRRNRPAVAILALIITLALTSTALWRRAETRRGEALVAQQLAETSRDEAQSLSQFLTKMLRSADPEKTRGAELTIREVVDVARQDVETVLVGRPKTQANMFATLGSVYDSLGLYGESVELATAALQKELDSSTPQANYALTARFADLGRAFYKYGDRQRAEENYQHALKMRRALGFGPAENHMLTFNLASVKTLLGKLEEAEALHRRVLEYRLSSPDIGRNQIGSSYYGLAAVYLVTEDYAQARPLLEKALACRREAYGEIHLSNAAVLAALADAHRGLGDADQALDSLEQALEIRRQVLGERHVLVAATHKLLAETQLHLGNMQLAETEIRHALAILEETTPSDRSNWGRVDAEAVLGWIKIQQGDRQQGLRLLETSHRILEDRLGPDDHRTRQVRSYLDEVAAVVPSRAVKPRSF